MNVPTGYDKYLVSCRGSRDLHMASLPFQGDSGFHARYARYHFKLWVAKGPLLHDRVEEAIL